jgi:hypothetical protein
VALAAGVVQTGDQWCESTVRRQTQQIPIAFEDMHAGEVGMCETCQRLGHAVEEVNRIVALQRTEAALVHPQDARQRLVQQGVGEVVHRLDRGNKRSAKLMAVSLPINHDALRGAGHSRGQGRGATPRAGHRTVNESNATDRVAARSRTLNLGKDECPDYRDRTPADQGLPRLPQR